jgi:hypothetical protein
MTDELRVEVRDRAVVGEVAIVVAPGTKANKRDRALDALLATPLHDAASELGVVLAASPSAFAFPLPGKDDAGRTRFAVSGRIEGDRLVPHRSGT